MASAKKIYKRTKPKRFVLPTAEEFERGCFLEDLLDGTVKATGMEEIKNPQGKLLRIEYDDPNG